MGVPGAAPGLITSEPDAPTPPIHLMAFGPDGFEEKAITSASEIVAFRGKWPVVWVNVDGTQHGPTIKALGATFGLHPLALEDVVHTHQRPKVEAYDDHCYVVLRMSAMEEGALVNEQVSLFFGGDYVLSVQELPGDCLEPVRARLRASTGRLRRSGPDYLAYALIDAIVDHHFPILEHYGDRLETLEAKILEDPTHAAAVELHSLRHELLALRRSVWPLREALGMLLKGEVGLIRPETQPYIRDCHDHALRILDMLETFRELAADLLDIYLSSVSNRMNEVMKLLTLISTVFIPLNFIAGVYGMNFNPERSPLNMPELNWYFGYPLALGLMATVCAVMLTFFWRKGWLADVVRFGRRRS